MLENSAVSRFTHTKVVFITMIFLITSFLIDSSFLKTYNLINKQSLLIQTKEIIFFINLSVSLISLFIILRYVKIHVGLARNLKLLESFTKLSYFSVLVLVGFLIFQIFYYHHYNTSVLMLITMIGYGAASILIGKTSILFLSWFRQNRKFVIFMYFFSMSMLLFNLILTNFLVNINLTDRPDIIREFRGGSIDISGGKYGLFELLYKLSSILSFTSLWLTTSILMYSSKDRLRTQIRYWIMPAILMTYFLISLFSKSCLDLFYCLFNNSVLYYWPLPLL